MFSKIRDIILEIKKLNLSDEEKSKLIYLLLKTYSSEDNYIVFVSSYLEFLETLESLNVKISQKLYDFLERESRRLKNIAEKVKV
ncbi:MAG: hypothetical protein QXR30_02425 [Candidatus Woesearchaeota archaeon]